MKSKTTQLAAYPYPAGLPYGTPQPEIIIEFSETDWRVIKDTRPSGWDVCGYLHCYDDLSAEMVTDAVRDVMIRYYFNHPRNLPGLGATPQQKYFSDLSIDDRERIGNKGQHGFYA